METPYPLHAITCLSPVHFAIRTAFLRVLVDQSRMVAILLKKIIITWTFCTEPIVLKAVPLLFLSFQVCSLVALSVLFVYSIQVTALCILMIMWILSLKHLPPVILQLHLVLLLHCFPEILLISTLRVPLHQLLPHLRAVIQIHALVGTILIRTGIV